MKRQLIFNNYQFVQNASGDAVDIFIDGDIVDEPTREMYQAFWGDECSVSFKSIRNQITSSKAKTFNIYINSGGGMVSDAFAIHDYIVDMEKKGITVNTIGMGIIASAATYILMAPKNSRITENSWFMIHNMSGGIYGDVNEIENYARTMRKFNDAVVTLYSKQTGMSKDNISDLMNKETWYQGEDAKNAGFVKECSGKEGVKNSISQEKWPFNNTAILNTINNSIPKQKEKGMKKNKITTAINDAFAKFFNGTTTLANVKPDDLKTAIIDALNAQDDDTSEEIEKSITNALQGENFSKLVRQHVNKALETVPENITKAITDSTNGLATKTELEKLTNDVAEKLGTPKNRSIKPGEKNTGEAENPEDAIANAEGWNR